MTMERKIWTPRTASIQVGVAITTLSLGGAACANAVCWVGAAIDAMCGCC
jgi:hypothetical protein